MVKVSMTILLILQAIVKVTFATIEAEHTVIDECREETVANSACNNQRVFESSGSDKSAFLNNFHENILNEEVSNDTIESSRVLVESAISQKDRRLPSNVQSISHSFGFDTESPTLQDDVSDSHTDERRHKNFDGQRISDPLHYYEELHAMYIEHGYREQCSFHDLHYENCIDNGLCCKLKFVCNHCRYFKWVNLVNNNGPLMPLNDGAVSGTITAGTGYSELKQEFASMGIKCMSDVSYRQHRQNLVASFEQTAHESMNEAAAMESELAIMEGDTIDEILHITVQADGSWLKRSYKSGKFDSLSGCAAIIGCRMKKVLYFGVRNKLCHVCDLAERKNCAPKKHKCYKNWGREQSSSSMGKDIIVQGFQESII